MTSLGMVTLLEHPDQLDALRADRSLIPGAVEELLRYLSIAGIVTTRVAASDIEVDGQLIGAADVVIIDNFILGQHLAKSDEEKRGAMKDVALEARVGDVVAVTQLVLRERQARDRGRWDVMAECFHPESTVELSWFRGSGAEFVASSAKNVRPDSRPIHRIGPPAVQVCGERAVAENSGAIAVRRVLGGVEADMVSYVRGLYRCEQHDGQWLIRSLVAIYEWDTLTPVVPGTELHVPREELERFRASYRFFAWAMSLLGVALGDDLYGEDRPEPLAQLYESAYAWVRE